MAQERKKQYDYEQRRLSYARIMNQETEVIFSKDKDFADPRIIEVHKYLRLRTSFMVSLVDKYLSLVDIYKMIEIGLKIARITMWRYELEDKIRLLDKIHAACKIASDKYKLNVFAVAINIELQSVILISGILEKNKKQIDIETDSFLTLTCDPAYQLICNDKIVYINNTFLTQEFKVGTEITLLSGESIVLICVEIIDAVSIQCKVHEGGFLISEAYVCARDVEILRPVLTKTDYESLKFAAEYNVDMVTINYVHSKDTLLKVKAFFKDAKRPVPLIIAGIATIEGLQNLPDIIKESDGIILSRTFLTHNLKSCDKFKIPQIQKWTIAKCIEAGCPIYIAGGIFQEALRKADFNYNDVADVVNAVIDGTSGFFLKPYDGCVKVTLQTMAIMDDICRSAEPYKRNHSVFQRMVQEITPLNAAQAAALACVVASRQAQATAIIVLTKTGKSAANLFYYQHAALVIAVTQHRSVCRKLRLYPNLVPLLFPSTLLSNKRSPERQEAMINMGMEYAVKRNYLLYNDYYIVFVRGHETSSYNDTISIFRTALTKKNTIECPEMPVNEDILISNSNIRRVTP